MTKGALIGGVVGAGSFSAIGLWYCTIGPNEVGECTAGRWVKPIVLSAAVGAGIGALIAALR